MRLEAVLAHHARRRPTHPAVVCGATTLDYRALQASIERLAGGLAARGVRAGDRVLCALPNGIAHVQLAYATFTLGATLVPVTTRLAPPEVAHILADVAPRVIAYDAAYRHAVGGASALRVVTGEPLADEIALDTLLAAQPALAAPSPSEDALILYTSGTTGRPKGAVLTHANMIVQNVFMHGLAWGIGEDDRYLVMTALAHRAGVSRLFNAFGFGGTLVILEKFDPEAVLAAIERERITMTGLVPTVIRMLLPALERDPARAASLRVATIGTEACPPSLKAALMRCLPQLRVHSVFGMTEALVTDIGGREQLERPDSVGRPLPWVEVRIVDEAGRALATGEVGEIVVRSGAPGAFAVLRAYYNQPDATAKAIRDGWFHTGDLGRLDAEGFLYIVDRKKDMVVSGGFNIYSKEVEQALMTHPAVVEAAVVGVPDPVFGEAVAAFVQADGIDVTTLDAFLRERIAGYKKPRHLFFVDALPKNTSGKVLKTVLREEARRRIS